ncbi:hypothetical protein WP12_19885 [Sphingomonas sp. SRS2]|nr:hypothetical protein WP12_19885 [Sphingomonas sp. SRS2]
MPNLLEQFVATTSASIIERMDLRARKERRAKLDADYQSGAIGDWFVRTLDGKRPWSHQSAALTEVARGRNIVVATGTASGKSLIFQAAAIREMLEGKGRVLVLYPQKALGGDQHARWRRDVKRAGLPPSIIGELHGDIGMDERLDVLDRARIILATPDVMHAWAMRQIGTPRFGRFLSELRLLVLDEAHVYDKVFGTNLAYFLRRLRVAQARLSGQDGAVGSLQVIATTATIADPAAHLEALTGLPFLAIGDAEDGSPRHGRTLLHIDGPDHGAAGEAAMADMLSKIATTIAPHAFIAFHDSRQGVERIAWQLRKLDVLSYRSGYEAEDRAAIEEALRAGRLRGVVATSALELGIDIPQFVIGLNLGIPASKKAFRQRVGRVGRAMPGLFAVVAPPHAFRQFGSSLHEYYQGSVEPSHLYLDNRFIQFAQARCLVAECDALDKIERTDWPESFAAIVDMASPGGRRPREFDGIAAIGGDRPHLNYPLRAIAEAEYSLQLKSGSSKRVGTIRQAQAIREAYPGATYLHLGRPMRVTGWRNSSYGRAIMLEPVRQAQQTSALISKTVNASIAAPELIEGRLLKGEVGLVAETELQVSEAVEGFRAGSMAMLYRDLKQTNPNMTRQQREISTTGVVIKIEQPWFAGTGDRQLKTRQAVARALVNLLAREHSIAGSDIDFADSNIAFHSESGPRKSNDCIAIYDGIHGGLRLTEPLFTHFGDFLRRLVIAAHAAGSEALVSLETATALVEWYEGLGTGSSDDSAIVDCPDGEFIVYAPGSELGVRVRGELVERTLLEPQLMNLQGDDLLVYRYESKPGVSAWVSHDQLETVGQNWRRVLWSPADNVIRELAA